MEVPTTVGVLALQGDVREHEAAFEDLGVATRRVRRPGDLEGLAGIVLPGGESTTLSKLLESSGLFDELHRAVKGDVAVFGTCAGLILLAAGVEDGRADQRSFGVLDVTVRRNGYGSQRFSFEGRVDPVSAALGGPGSPMPAVFIRAPVVVDAGPDVEVLATEGSGTARVPVVVRQHRVLGATFHPELTGDRRLHRLFVSMVAGPGSPGRADQRGRAGE